MDHDFKAGDVVQLKSGGTRDDYRRHRQIRDGRYQGQCEMRLVRREEAVRGCLRACHAQPCDIKIRTNSPFTVGGSPVREKHSSALKKRGSAMTQSANTTVTRFVGLLQLTGLGAGVGLAAWAGIRHGSSNLSAWLEAGGLGALAAVVIAVLYALILVLRNALVARWNRFATRKHSSEDLFVAALTDETLSKAEADTLLKMSLDKLRKDAPSSNHD